MSARANSPTEATALVRTSSQPAAGPVKQRWPEGHPRRKQILLVLCLSLLVVVIDNTVLNTALPTLAVKLGAGTSALQWITDAYTLCFAALLIPAGAIGDRFGRRRSLVAGLTLYALGSLAAAFAGSANTLILDRVVMGVGAAFVMPATLSILNSVFPVSERAQAIAAWSAVAGVGIVLGPTLGGALLSHFFWGSVFLVNIPLVAVALAECRESSLSPEPVKSTRLDLGGTVLAAGGLVALVDAIIEAPTRGWTGGMTIAEAAVGLALLGWFVVFELRSQHPLIDLRIFKERAFAASALAVTVIFFSLFGSLFALTQYLQLVHGYSPFSAGLRALPFAIAMGAMSPLSAQLAKRVGPRAVITGGLVLMSVGLLALSTAGVDDGLSASCDLCRSHGSGDGPRHGSGQHDHHGDGPRGSGRRRKRCQRHCPRGRWSTRHRGGGKHCRCGIPEPPHLNPRLPPCTGLRRPRRHGLGRRCGCHRPGDRGVRGA